MPQDPDNALINASRDISLGAQTELLSTSVRPFFLVSCAFADETVYMWTGAGNLTWSGHTYLGVGSFGNISPIIESIDTQAQGIQLSLSSIPLDLLNQSMTQMQTGKQCWVYLGFMDESGNVIADPIPAFMGMMDQPTINIDTNTATVTISVENRLSDLNRSRGGRYTDADQRARYPNDGSLKYVSWLSDQFIDWKG